MEEFAETLIAFFFMFIGLGFFVFMVWFVHNATERQHERDFQRDREFGVPEEKRPLIAFGRTRRR